MLYFFWFRSFDSLAKPFPLNCFFIFSKVSLFLVKCYVLLGLESELQGRDLAGISRLKNFMKFTSLFGCIYVPLFNRSTDSVHR